MVREILLKLWIFPGCIPTLSHEVCTATLSEKMNGQSVRTEAFLACPSQQVVPYCLSGASEHSRTEAEPSPARRSDPRTGKMKRCLHGYKKVLMRTGSGDSGGEVLISRGGVRILGLTILTGSATAKVKVPHATAHHASPLD